MSKTKKNDLRQQIEKQLVTTFSELGESKGQKKLKKTIKKASKILSKGLKASSLKSSTPAGEKQDSAA